MEIRAIKTWHDLRHGVVELEDDVLGIVQQIQQLDPRLHVFYNDQTEKFDLVESCLDGTDRLVFSVEELDARVLHRLMGADHWGGNPTPERFIRPDDEDFVAQMDADNEAHEAALDEESRDKLRDAGERLAWALDIGTGLAYKTNIRVTKDIS